MLTTAIGISLSKACLLVWPCRYCIFVSWKFESAAIWSSHANFIEFIFDCLEATPPPPPPCADAREAGKSKTGWRPWIDMSMATSLRLTKTEKPDASTAGAVRWPQKNCDFYDILKEIHRNTWSLHKSCLQRRRRHGHWLAAAKQRGLRPFGSLRGTSGLDRTTESKRGLRSASRNGPPGQLDD